MKTKAKIDFSGYSSGELGGIALNIKEQLTVNAAQFPNLPYPVATTLGPAIGNFNTKLEAKEHPGKDRTSGHFGFAGHSDPVMFRNISLKKLQ